jgi:DNA-binding transcriptional LysR family regulator
MNTQPDLNDLVAFLAVARERSFTKAAASLGKSQSALSKTISDMEAGLGVRLLSRTTRSVSPTEAGERLFQSIAPDLEHIASVGGQFIQAVRRHPDLRRVALARSVSRR